ncbi:hypothetical protein HG536_0A08280 [Torulaspora globosa]|uniref:Uncharacterized protein n=1 Tax=Torulaspora globosa TaxID=48254 RepID=A0A7G3ZBX7_9SACH|nr:uncharacterized protein HG536_0A08280 [Torulaspora globosa]QLL31013.1 hypothetical protein HG536_0A08280 [Torulaspora globosa]
MPKVDVTVEQLRSIYGQLYDALDEKMRLHLPAEAAEGKDHVRREVGLQLQDFLSQVMEMASSSVRVVNSDDPSGKMSVSELISKSQEKYVEPFDLELNEKVRQAYQEWEDQTVQVAVLRRNAPQQVNQAYVTARDAFLSRLDARIEQLQAEDHAGVDSEQELDAAGSFGDSYWQEAAEQYERSLLTLRDAQARIPQTRSDITKMKSLVAYLEDQLE